MKRLAPLVTGALLLALAGLGPVTSVLAETNSISFEPATYLPGTIDGQDGWGGTSETPVNPSIDQAVVLTSAYPPAVTGSFATQSFRMSNKYTTGSFFDQVFSKSLTDEAGEASAVSDGFSGGTRQTRFVAEWEFASATGAAQPGLSVVMSPDRGDGARMSWIQMTDTGGAGLEVNFSDYQHGIGFVTTNNVASGLSRTTAHTIKVQMDFVDGIANDVVRVYVDGELVHTGTSWEDYYRDVEVNPTRPVDSLLFRVAGTAAPDTVGKGFLFDNLTLFSGPTPPAARALTIANIGSGSGTVTATTDGGEPDNCTLASGASCSLTYDNGTVVTLSAAAAGGSTFSGWSSGGCSGTGSCVVTMNGDKTVNAIFNQNSTGNTASGFVLPGGTIQTCQNTSSTDNTCSTITLPNTGPGATITITEQTGSTSTVCNGLCSNQTTTYSITCDPSTPCYTDIKNPPKVILRYRTPGTSTAAEMYFLHSNTSTPFKILDCRKNGIANPNPCVSARKRLGYGTNDLQVQVLVTSDDPIIGKR